MANQSESPHLPDAIIRDQFTFAIPSHPDWIEPTVEYLKQRALLCGACHTSRATKLVIALHEALTNAIVHGNLEITSELKEREDDSFARLLAERSNNPEYASRLVMVDVGYDSEHCTWSITDQGAGFDTEKYINKTVPDESELWLSSGRGILLIRSFVDHFHYEEGGRRIIMRLHRASGEEKRHHPRLAMHRRVEVAPIRGDGSVDWDAAYQAVTQNYSETGIGLIQDHFANGDRIIIGIESEGRPMMYLPAQIRHCRSVEEGLVELGCQFQISVNPPPHREAFQPVEVAVEGLLDRFRRASVSVEDDRRAHPREAYTEQIEVEDASGNRITAISRDLSKGGISFISPSAIPLEKRTIYLSDRENESLRIVAKIVRCTQLTHGFYDIGAAFLSIGSASGEDISRGDASGRQGEGETRSGGDKEKGRQGEGERPV